MIIPSKHSGYQAGIRIYPGDGPGGDGGGGDSGTSGSVSGGGSNLGANPNAADVGFNYGEGASAGQAPGVGGTPSQGQGYGGDNGILASLGALFGSGPSGLFGPVNTGGLSGYVDPSGARYGGFDGGGYGSDITSNNSVVKPVNPNPVNPTPVNPTPVNPTPVTPPPANSGVYKSQYQNYARPTTQFSTSLYGTQPMNSPALNSGMSRENINNTIGNFYQTNPKGYNADASSVLDFMRSNGLNREDFQSYGGLDNYGPQMSMPQAQTQQPFNPYTNSSQPYDRFYGRQQQSYQPQQQQQYSPPRSMGLPNPDSYVDSYSGRSTGLGGRGSYQAPQQQQYNPFSYGGGGQQFVQPQMNNPFSYQPQQQQQFNQFRPGQSIEYPQQQQFNPYRQYETSLGSYNPYQQQQPQQQQYNPFSYQPPPPQYGQPQYGQPYQSQQDLPQYSQPEIPTSSGPSQAIYGRSSAMRGTPNVMRRAEGGIAGILKK